MLRAGPESSTADHPRPRLDRAAVEAGTPVRTLAGRNVSKADVRVLRIAGRTIAVKDYAARPFLARQTIGRYLVGRECRAYTAAAGIPGLPEFLGRVDAFALATVWIEATPLSALDGRILPDEVFDRLAAIVDALHRSGVALADLHHRDVLIGADRAVHVVDLATAVVATPRSLPWRRALLARLEDHDRLAVARLRARFTGRSEADALAALDPAAVRRHAAGRRVKAFWDRLRGKGA